MVNTILAVVASSGISSIFTVMAIKRDVHWIKQTTDKNHSDLSGRVSKLEADVVEIRLTIAKVENRIS